MYICTREGTTIGRTAGWVTDCETVWRENISEEHQAYTTAKRLKYTIRSHIFVNMIWLQAVQLLLHFCSDSLEGQVVNSRVPWIVIYVLYARICTDPFIIVAWNCLRARSAFIRWSSMNGVSQQSNLFEHQWFSMATTLVDHLQTKRMTCEHDLSVKTHSYTCINTVQEGSQATML